MNTDKNDSDVLLIASLPREIRRGRTEIADGKIDRSKPMNPRPRCHMQGNLLPHCPVKKVHPVFFFPLLVAAQATNSNPNRREASI